MNLNLILDSGAFSAWNQRTTVSLEKYTDFCLKWGKYVQTIVSLDVIPGEFGKKKLSRGEVEQSASQGWANYLYMLQRGVPKEKLVHVFHQGESFQWLERIVSEMGYVGLSPANDRTTSEKIEWLDNCMDYVTDEHKMPTVKFHGFAVTSHLLMTRFPWYSVDSTSWVQVSRHGSVFIPQKDKGEYNFVLKPHQVAVSTRSPLIYKYGRQDNQAKHFLTLSPSDQAHIIEYLNTLGITMEQLQTEYRARDTVNVEFLKGLVKQIKPWPRPFEGKVKTLW